MSAPAPIPSQSATTTTRTPQQEFEELQDWLQHWDQQITPFDHFQFHSLRRALSWGLLHLRGDLDTQLKVNIYDAREHAHMAVHGEMFFDGRLDSIEDVDSVQALGMNDREEVVRLLEEVRDEILWLRLETDRPSTLGRVNMARVAAEGRRGRTFTYLVERRTHPTRTAAKVAKAKSGMAKAGAAAEKVYDWQRWTSS